MTVAEMLAASPDVDRLTEGEEVGYEGRLAIINVINYNNPVCQLCHVDHLTYQLVDARTEVSIGARVPECRIVRRPAV